MEEVLFAHTSCVILSAGSSVRMGTHKALLKFDSKKTFLQQITETYLLAGIDQLVVVVNSELFNLIHNGNLTLSEKVLLVINDKPELGRFYSLQTGIKHLKSGNSCFFQNIDNPFTSEKLLRELILLKDKADVILPAFQNRSGHPVLLNSLVCEKILTVKNPDIRIDEFLKNFNTLKVEMPDSNILVNINSPEEFYKAGFRK